MFGKIVISALALVSALGTTVWAMEDPSTVVVASLENRVEERRLERLGESSSSSAQSSSSLSRYRFVSSASSSPSFLKRVQQRLQERLDALRLRSPEEYNTVINMLRRREERRVDRLVTQEPSLKQQVADGVNMERALRGIPALRYHRSLELSAQHHAQDMFDRNYFSHENLEGERSGERIKKTGYGVVNAQECRCSYRVFLGENIAKGQTSVAQVIREWMESPSHREAMLSRDYTDIGVGIVDDIWVLNFGAVEINPAE